MYNFMELKGLVRGEVIARGEALYAARRGDLLYNRRAPDRQPSAIVRARDVRDVQAVVRYAAANDLTVSPRGSGHNWSGIAMQDGIVLDLSGLNNLAIDPLARTAEVGPALDNRTMARQLTEHSLAFPLGHCGHVSLSGYLLGGGLGWNSERWGLGCHNVIGFDVVTADGALHHASETENPDLFWAARGGGPAFFGVVTRYRLALHALPSAIVTTNRFYPLSRIGDLQQAVLHAKAELADNIEYSVVLLPAPPQLSSAGPHVVLATATVFAETESDSQAAMEKISSLAPDGALYVETTPSSFEALYDPFDQALPAGKRYAVDSFWSAAPSDGYMTLYADQISKAPSPLCMALAVVLPPQQNEPAQVPDTAFSMSGNGFGLVYAIWDDPAEDDAHLAWLRATSDALAHETVGHYVGEADLARPGWLRRCYSPEAWARLISLREKWDPRGVFRRPELTDPEFKLAG
ncbi:MAG: FAD-binding oxidoreductase [Silicimonas sp.]|nr:FAD-binding oxidoreductase [Silicimonas sp.]